jgi:hypothetical protein
VRTARAEGQRKELRKIPVITLEPLILQDGTPFILEDGEPLELNMQVDAIALIVKRGDYNQRAYFAERVGIVTSDTFDMIYEDGDTMLFEDGDTMIFGIETMNVINFHTKPTDYNLRG